MGEDGRYAKLDVEVHKAGKLKVMRRGLRIGTDYQLEQFNLKAVHCGHEDRYLANVASVSGV